MAMISLEEAATRLDLSLEVLQEWTQKGLLHVHTVITAGDVPPAIAGQPGREQQVDEEELAEVAESLGWLQLSAENWDDVEEL